MGGCCSLTHPLVEAAVALAEAVELVGVVALVEGLGVDGDGDFAAVAAAVVELAVGWAGSGLGAGVFTLFPGGRVGGAVGTV